MRFIEHIIEPTRLLLAWQSFDEKDRTRRIIGEIARSDNNFILKYTTDAPDFLNALNKGFKPYPAFPDQHQIYTNPLDAFMRRLPPRTRGDFPQYLEALRIKPDAQLSDFALLGYSGAKLPSDGFSFIHPFESVIGPCELLLEVAGYRHQKIHKKLELNQPATFTIESENEKTHLPAVEIMVEGERVGYVNNGLISTFIDWINSNRIIDARIEKLNETKERPSLYLFVRVKSC